MKELYSYSNNLFMISYIMSFIDQPSNCYFKTDVECFSLQFRTPFTLVGYGVSKSGKSSIIRDLLLENTDAISPRHPNILYIYGEEDSTSHAILKNRFGDKIIFKRDLTDDVKELIHTVKDCFIVLDDLLSTVYNSTEVQKLFVQGSHHRRVSVILITQNLFAKGTHARTIALNANYYLLFDNPRDRTVINTFERQAFPNQVGFLRSAYRQFVIDNRYGYLALDFQVTTRDEYRIWTGIKQNEIPFLIVKDEEEEASKENLNKKG